MTIAVTLFICAVIAEFFYFRYDSFSKYLYSFSLLILVLLSSIFLLYKAPNIIILLVFIASLYRCFNIMRVIRPRMHQTYLQRATTRTSLWLGAAQLVILTIYLVFNSSNNFGLLMHYFLFIILYAELVLSLIVLFSTVKNRRATTPESKTESDEDFPDVSVCIPARNESDDLRDCLDILLASDYPKLEIVVLDDCSTTKHTPDIIKAYAQSGVEFISGNPPPSYWLAKNWAYDQLAKAASGDVIIFCGVDARFKPNTISSVVSQMRRKNLLMVSVIPTLLNLKSNPFIQTMRYWWELALPRNLLNRPAVISTFWAIEAEYLKKLGSFNSTRRMITPEAYFARQLSKDNKYQFFRDSQVFGLSTEKTSAEQTSTAIRVRYPQLHKRPENVFLFSSLMILLTVVPFIGALALWITNPLAAIISLLIVTCYVSSYSMIIRSVRQIGSLSVSLMFPFAVLIDLFLLHLSMYRYEFSSVNWKGRNICIPVMHETSSHLGRKAVH